MRQITARYRIFAAALCIALSLPLPAIAAGEPVYRFGVVPQQAAAKLARLWVPMLNRLGEMSGYKLRFDTARSIPEFERRLADGRYDFAYMNPYHYTVFHESLKYRAFAKQRGKRIQGLVVVRKASPLAALKDLDGTTMAYPAPGAFAASMLPRARLRKDGIKIEAKYVSSHDSVYQSVANGLFPAGGGIERTLNSVAPDVRSQLRILWKTGLHTPHAFAAHPRVPVAAVSAVQNAMGTLGTTSEGMDILVGLKFRKGIEPANDSDWDDIRGLGLEYLNQPGKED